MDRKQTPFPLFKLLGMGALGLSLLACRPVLAIGWPEFFFILVLVAFLLGGTLYGFYKRYKRFMEFEAKKKKKKE